MALPLLHRRGFLASGMSLAASAALAAPMRSSSGPLRVGAVADCQYADQDDNGARMYRRSPAKLRAAVDHFNTLTLDHVVHLGDFIDKGWASFDAQQPAIDALRHPWRFVLGNHDFAVDDDKKALVAARLGMPARYYSFETRGWVFLALDGNDLSEYGWPAGSPELALSQRLHRERFPGAPDWDGGIGAAQLQWIDATLADAGRRGLKAALYCHFPIFPANPHNLWNATEVTDLVVRHRAAKVWINGHNHDGNYGETGGLHCVNLKGMLDTEETAYAVLDFGSDHLRLTGFGRQTNLRLKLRR
ncbi:metallophosphoesterase [Caulobacter sp. CCG-8]|uniref:metallophosphoesterase n=1 Tax=Caulobacter sp. CCG-8 TaxID=3127958 RepID=UPI00307CDD95